MKLLLVEDTLETADLLKATLETQGYGVVHKENGLEALKAICDEFFHAVLLDYSLPDIDALRLYQLMRPSLKNTPIILLTGYFDKFDPAAVNGFGFDGFLTKPIDPNQLLQAVQKLTEKPPFQPIRVLSPLVQSFIFELFSVKRNGFPKN